MDPNAGQPHRLHDDPLLVQKLCMFLIKVAITGVNRHEWDLVAFKENAQIVALCALARQEVADED